MGLSRAWPHGVLGALLVAAIPAAPRDASAQPSPTAPIAQGAQPNPAAPIAPAAQPNPAAPIAPAAPAPTAAEVLAPAPNPNELPDDPNAELAKYAAPRGFSYHLFGTLFFGDGLRFNNPYRLKTQLGDSAKTVSATAPYVDLGLGFALGDAFGLQHGLAINVSIAMSGVGQAVFAPAYLATYRGTSSRVFAFGRLGPAIIASPDANVGAELGVGGAVLVTAKVAITGEIVGDLFYGAATREAGFPVYPIVSAQLGLLFDHEVLP